MAKFCTNCGTALNEDARFCTNCGVNSVVVQAESAESAESAALVDSVESAEWMESAALVEPVESVESAESVAQAGQAEPNHKGFLSRAGEQIKTEAQVKVGTYAQVLLPDKVPAAGLAGEFVLPLSIEPLPGLPPVESLPAILKSGFAGLASGLKRTLGDKKRLAIVITLVVIWLPVNFLSALGIAPLPVRVLSWLTAARGSVIGGSVGKGLVAALLAQIIIEKGMFQSLQGGIGQLISVVKSGKNHYTPLLFGAGIGLIACNLLVSSTLQSTMVPIAGFVLSAQALTRNGYLRRVFQALPFKHQRGNIPFLMQGWALGFAVFIAVCFLPGGSNGYFTGILLLFASAIIQAVNNRKVEVVSK